MPRWTPALKLVPISLLACLGSASEALAQTATGEVVAVPEAVHEEVAPPPPAAPPVVVGVPVVDPTLPAQPPADTVAPFKRHAFFGAWGGVGFAVVSHPQLATPRVYGPLLALNAGYTLSEKWSIGLEFTNLEKPVSRNTTDERFAAASGWLHTQADCLTCKPPKAGAPILDVTMLLNTVGPRVDFTPFGRDGLYVGASGGVAIITVIDPRVGAGGTARVGFRLTLADILTVGAEGGVQGQAYSGASVVMPYGALSVRLALVEPPKKGRQQRGVLPPLPGSRQVKVPPR